MTYCCRDGSATDSSATDSSATATVAMGPPVVYKDGGCGWINLTHTMIGENVKVVPQYMYTGKNGWILSTEILPDLTTVSLPRCLGQTPLAHVVVCVCLFRFDTGSRTWCGVCQQLPRPHVSRAASF